MPDSSSTWGLVEGKTATTLSAFTQDHLPALVIAPKRVAEQVWPTEARIWRPDLKLRLAAGREDRRREELGSAADITVISRDNFAQVLDEQPGRWRTIVFDELSSFKSSRSSRFKDARKLVKGFDYRWGLTGTPSPNGLLDLWSQLYLLDDGERLGTTIGGYRSRYFTPGHQLPNGVITSWNLRPGAAQRIHSLIDDICLSMSAEGRLDLPEVNHNVVNVPLLPGVRSVYKRLKNELVVNLDMLGGRKALITAGTPAALSNKLSQVAAGFLYADDGSGSYTVLHREKVKAAQEIVSGTGSPILMFYRYQAEAEMLRKAMPELVHSIDEPDIVERWNAGQIPILLTHPQSAGHGLNLQHGGHTMVWTSLPWSLEEWEQGIGRLDRQGQKHPVVVHALTSPGTVDGKIHTALLGKTSVQEALLDHLESPL